MSRAASRLLAGAAALVVGLLGAGGCAFAAPGMAGGPAAAPGSGPRVVLLCYHDLTTDPRASLEAVSPEFLRAQIRSCKAAGWTFLSLGELLAAKDRFDRLPRRVMVLTFDDGYRSFYEQALPILEQEDVKATLNVITSFVDHPPAGMPTLMSWQQIRQAEQSGRVEIASHSHALHRYETDNPYRDTAPSVAARRYLLQEVRYETRDEYRSRVRDDLQESERVLRQQLGHPVAVLAWPYGEYNQMAEALAEQAGFTTRLALGTRAVTREDLRSGCLPRVMVLRTMNFSRDDLDWLHPPQRPIQAAQVDLDDLYDPDPGTFRRRVDEMVDQVRSLGATHVFLQACPDPDGDGMLRNAYFMNHQVAVKADVWSMVASKLSQAGIKVWIRAPSMNLSWVWQSRPEWRIPTDENARADGTKPWYYRLSPNLPEARRAAMDFFGDIAVYLPIDGVLFDDDAYMLPEERLNGSLAKDARTKAEAIDDLLDEVKATVRAWRPECQFGRNLYAPVVDRGGVDKRFAQDLGKSLEDNDLTVVMAYSRMEGHDVDAARWAGVLGARALRRWRPPAGRAGAPAPLMLKFQTYDWNEHEQVPAIELQAMIEQARRSGITQFGLYPVSPERSDLPAHLLDGTAPAGLADQGSMR